MQLVFRIIIISIITSFTVGQTFAQPSNIFANMDEEINLEPWQSYQKLKSLEQTAKQNDNQYLWWLFRKAQAENLLYFHNEFIDTVTQAQALVTINTSVYIRSMLNVFSGVIAQREGRYDEAVDLFTLGIDDAQKANLNYVFLIGKQELAYTRSLLELYETSLIELQEAYVEAFTLNDNFLIALINETYGAIYGYMGDYPKSIEYYDKALASYEALGYKAQVAEATYGLASTYRYWKKFDLAIEKFKLYQKQVTYTPNTEISFFAAYGLGMTLAEKGDCTQALAVIEKALTLNGQIDYNAELYKRMAACYISQGELTSAQYAIEKADEIFNQIIELEGTTWQLEVQKLRAELAFQRQDLANAYQLLKSYYEKNTKLLTDKSNARMVRVRSAMELEHHNIEIALLQQRNKVQQLQVEREQQKSLIQKYFIIFVLVVMLVVIYAFVAQQKATRKIIALSVIDSLSQLYNRKYVFEQLNKAFEHITPGKSELSLVMLDIDDFKMLNDQYGHPFGDEVIREIAKIAKNTLRTEDVIGRIGGEEFLCILPRANIEKGNLIAERLRQHIAEHNFVTSDGQMVKTTASIGIACVSENCLNAQQLYANVDKALYLSKSQGKNRVYIYSES